MCVQKSITERNSGVYEYALLMSYIENDPKNLALYLEIYERSVGLKEKVKELVKEALGINISPLVLHFGINVSGCLYIHRDYTDSLVFIRTDSVVVFWVTMSLIRFPCIARWILSLRLLRDD